jgi:hypothetical protein
MSILLFLAASMLSATPSADAAKCIDPRIVPMAANKENGGRFGTTSTEFLGVQENVHEAFLRACRKGLLARESIFPLSVGGGQLHLRNAPDANVPIFNADNEPGRGWQLYLEYPFVAGDGSIKVPTADQVEEAIYCAVIGVTVEEQEESGRCLPD